ncbi:SH3 domain-containing protein [Streptomyces collinus]|uniref:SH3 domain-containing protein n=1 Tax=Streptomyces collinus TaxID=42684 RepID=UPI002943D8E4|nr:SH3 domain-containing protein [Streptomyces collinus]
MRRRSAVIATLATALAVSVPGAAAVAAPAETSYTVVPYTAVNLRYGPGSGYQWMSTLQFGHTYTAYCWVYGEMVVDNGYRNNIWIYTYGGRGVGVGYASAVYLRGDERAGLPASAQC